MKVWKSAPVPSFPCLYLLCFVNLFCTCHIDPALAFLLAPAGEESGLYKGYGSKARLNYPRETKRDKRSYLHWHPRSLADFACMPSANRWGSVFAAMFDVIQQILAEGLWCAGPYARNRGREDE